MPKLFKVTLLAVFLIISSFALYYSALSNSDKKELTDSVENFVDDSAGGLNETFQSPLSVEHMRRQEYPGSDLVIEQQLSNGSNYERYIASYKSEGLKIYGLFTVPTGEKPATGWPVVVFNHGYIAPSEYQTTGRYVSYQDGFARNGYITFKSDYRGHGNSEGEAGGGYGNPGYTVDVLNAVSSLKKRGDVDKARIGMWGHSMGGHITLRSMVVTKDIKAGVVWAGVVASYSDLLTNWRRNRPSVSPNPTSWRSRLTQQFGDPTKNPTFWDSISPNAYLKDVSGPIQLHHGSADSSVPDDFSVKLDQEMKDAGKISELYIYPGDDHNLASNFNTAMQRSIEFFDKHVKGE